MKQIDQVVGEIIPPMYDNIAQDMRYPRGYNLAASNQCHILSKGLHVSLTGRGIEARREYHEVDDGNVWHYVIAHTPEDAVPTEEDIITDLNPWQYMDSAPGHLTYLHGPRQEVMDILSKHDAPDYIIALRGLETVVEAHRMTLMNR